MAVLFSAWVPGKRLGHAGELSTFVCVSLEDTEPKICCWPKQMRHCRSRYAWHVRCPTRPFDVPDESLSPHLTPQRRGPEGASCHGRSSPERRIRPLQVWRTRARLISLITTPRAKMRSVSQASWRGCDVRGARAALSVTPRCSLALLAETSLDEDMTRLEACRPCQPAADRNSLYRPSQP